VCVTVDRQDYNARVVDVAVLEEIAEIFASLRDVDVVLARFLALARSIAHTPYGAIYLRDEQRRDFRRWPETRGMPEVRLPETLVETVFGSDRALRTFSLDERWLDVYDPVRVARDAGLHGGIGLTLRYGGELVGVLGLAFPSPLALTPQTIRTLTSVARFPAAAIMHARAQALSDRHARLADILRRFGETALGTLDVTALHQLILDTTVELTASDRASITEVRGDQLRLLARVGKEVALVGSEEKAALMTEVLSSDVPQLVSDVARADDNQLLVQLARRSGAGSFIALAMRRQSRLIGHIFAGAARAHAYRAEEVEALRILASMAAAVLEQRNAQALVEQQTHRLAATVEHLPILIEVYAASGELTLSNAAAHELRHRLNAPAGTVASPFPGFTLLALDGQPIAADALPAAIAMRGTQPKAREVVLARSDGTREATLLMTAAPLRTPAGAVESVVLGCQDVSTLHELLREKDRFLRVVAHELRTPITALSATTQLIESAPQMLAEASQRERLLERVRRQSERLRRLIEQLLDSVRAQAAELPLLPSDVDLTRLCRDVVETTMPADGPRIHVRADGPLMVRCDPLRIEQVVTNLLSNSLRYGRGSDVIIVVRRSDNRAQIAVSDSGIGIPEEQIAMLFTPFFRGSNASQRPTGGLGLGLHIAREIVQRHGGTISVTSRQNEGTTFLVELPLG
jgi:signal transduction histidine kinase/transcriptional regulator with GAF, ATPase, and Fis domain